MPGGGGIRAANYVAKIAPQDGTILTIVSQGLPVDQALGLNPSFQADLRDFHWVGNISSSNQVLVTWHTSPTKTLNDLMTRETVIGSTQAGSISVQMPAVLNNIVGTKIKIIFGYPDGRDVNLAMERGEVEGRATNPWASYLQHRSALHREEADHPDHPDRHGQGPGPSRRAADARSRRATPPAATILEFMSKAVTVGRPIATTPGVPAERVAALRRAFDLTLKDPEFIKEAQTQRAELQPMTGAELDTGRARRDRRTARPARARQGRDPAEGRPRAARPEEAGRLITTRSLSALILRSREVAVSKDEGGPAYRSRGLHGSRRSAT